MTSKIKSVQNLSLAIGIVSLIWVIPLLGLYQEFTPILLPMISVITLALIIIAKSTEIIGIKKASILSIVGANVLAIGCLQARASIPKLMVLGGNSPINYHRTSSFGQFSFLGLNLYVLICLGGLLVGVAAILHFINFGQLNAEKTAIETGAMEEQDIITTDEEQETTISADEKIDSSNSEK